MIRILIAAAALSLASVAYGQNAGTVTNHAFVIGKGAGQTGYTSLLCGSAQLAVGQSAADPICRTLTGDVTLSAAGATTIGATKVTSAMLNADVFSTAHTWAGQQTFVAPVLGTPASGTLTNATGLPVSTGISGLGTGIATWLATPSSANLASALTDETGTGVAVFATGPTFPSFITLTEIASPSNPAADNLKLFSKDVAGSTHLFTRDSAGTEVDITAAGGGGAAAATQAEQETGSSTSVYVSPGRQQFHLSAAKAWARCTAAGALSEGYNISGGTCNRSGNGEYTLNFTTAFSTSTFPCFATTQSTNLTIASGPASTSSASVSIRNLSSVATDSIFQLVCFGDQ